jgi:hypothetical protein
MPFLKYVTKSNILLDKSKYCNIKEDTIIGSDYMSGWYVTANDIKVWTETNKRRSEEELPLLVKKLIEASCNPKSINFPSGDAVSIGGWDGVLEVEDGNEFVPSGTSGWEFGTNENVKGKADGDYYKRLENSAPLNIEDTTFVFVTSRLWTRRDSWVLTKLEENKWKSVLGLNAESLQEWLEKCPAVHRWFSQLIGKRSEGLWDIEEAWRVFSMSTGVPLQVCFFTNDRRDQVNKFSALLEGTSNVYRVKSRSLKEAYGFILSLIKETPIFRSRCLIVKNQTAWEFIASNHKGLILIPKDFQPSGLGAAISKGHIVIIPVDEKNTDSEAITLNQPQRISRQKSLENLGLSSESAIKIFEDTKGYFEPILRHTLMVPIDTLSPDWPDSFPPEMLFAIFFATEWREDIPKDKEVMELLSGVKYEEFQRLLISLSKVVDPPIRKIGAVWQLISKIDFWLLIASKIAKPYVDRFISSVGTVLSDADPSFDMKPEERYLANIKGATPLYSQKLKHGVADSLVILSVYGDEYSSHLGGERTSDLIEQCLKNLFESNNNSKFWYSINGITPLLAESAPNIFLEAVEEASKGDNPPLLDLFLSEGEGVFGGCYHSGLLWGLELISWDKQYFSKVSLCLARLAEIDPGGKYSNRPFNSLVQIYLGWINNTTATHEERLQVIEQVIIPNYYDVAWKMMIKLLLNNVSVSSGIAKPKYKELSEVQGKPTRNEYFKYVEEMVNISIKEVELDFENRVPELIDNLNSFTTEQSDFLIDRMLKTNADSIEYKSREIILKKLRNILSRHREYSHAKWAWPDTLLSKLEDIYNHFNHNDLVEKHKYLFNDYWPEFVVPIIKQEFDYKVRDELLLQKRIIVLEKIYGENSIQGLENLIEKIKLPRLLGSVVFKSSILDVLKVRSLLWIDSDNEKKQEFSVGLLSSLASKDLSNALNLFDKEWHFIKKSKYLLCLPITNETIQLVHDLNEEGRRYYWKHIKQYNLLKDEEHLINNVASNLLEYKRPLAAINSLSGMMSRFDSIIDSQIVKSILIDIALNPHDKEEMSLQSVRYEIIKAIEFIQDGAAIEENEISQIEWYYLKLFKFEEIKPSYLIKKVTKDSDFFVQLITWSFKRNDGKEDPEEDITKEVIAQRAEISLELLDTVNILPGQNGNDIDVGELMEWLKNAKALLKEVGREEVGDIYIGKYLANTPKGSDGVWPHPSVRKIIEHFKSKEIEEGIINGVYNSRGVTTRNPYEGGKQEKELSESYYSQAKSLQLVSPRTTELLRAIGKIYERDAEREDREVELL